MCYFMWEDGSPDAPALFSGTPTLTMCTGGYRGWGGHAACPPPPAFTGRIRCVGAPTQHPRGPRERGQGPLCAQPPVPAGDTLFVGGCGKFFEGTAEQMYTNLTQTLGTLPKETVSAWCHPRDGPQNRGGGGLKAAAVPGAGAAVGPGWAGPGAGCVGDAGCFPLALQKVFCGHECTVRNLKFALKVEPENEAVKKKLAWAKVSGRAPAGGGGGGAGCRRAVGCLWFLGSSGMTRTCPRCPPRCRRSSSTTPSCGSRKRRRHRGGATGPGGWSCPQALLPVSPQRYPFSQWLRQPVGNPSPEGGEGARMRGPAPPSWGFLQRSPMSPSSHPARGRDPPVVRPSGEGGPHPAPRGDSRADLLTGRSPCRSSRARRTRWRC